MRPRDQKGWRVPRPNTIAARIYMLAKKGMGATEIDQELGRKVNNVRVHLFKIRRPERANELGKAKPIPRMRKIITPEEAHARQGVAPRATYLFKHALVQDAAYGTLLREPRRALHARIAEVLETQFTD